MNLIQKTDYRQRKNGDPYTTRWTYYYEGFGPQTTSIILIDYGVDGKEMAWAPAYEPKPRRSAELMSISRGFWGL